MTTQTTRIYALETSMRMFGAIAAGAVQCQQPSPASALLITEMHNIKDLYFGIWN